MQSKRAAVRLCCCCGLLERLVALVELFEQLLLHLVVAEHGRELLGRLEEEVELPLVRDEEEELCGRW